MEVGPDTVSTASL